MAAFPVPAGSVIIVPGGPDNSLPGMGGRPVDPGYGIEEGRPSHPIARPPGPVDPGYGVPLPPVIDNGLPGSGHRPDNSLPPTYPVRPDNSLPVAPGVWPKPPMPPTVWPPLPPLYPSHPIYPVPPNVDNTLPPGVDNTLPGTPPGVDNTLPGSPPGVDNTLPGVPGTPSQPIYLPGHVWPPLPPSITGNVIAFCWIVGVGYRWVVLTPEPGRPTHPIAPGGEQPDNSLPPYAQPKG